MKYFYLFCLSLCALSETVTAQLDGHHQLIEELIEEISSVGEPETDPALIYDYLMFYILNPLDINATGTDDLRNLYFINELQIANLLEYRKENGRFLSLYELQYIDGFSPEDIRKIIPFIKVTETEAVQDFSPADAVRYGRHQYFLRMQGGLQEQKGFSAITDADLASNPDSRYLGSPLKIYNRYQFTYGKNVQAGYVAEKDPGEEFFTGSNRNGFDYFSAHLQVNGAGRFKTIALGDFQASFGQGLVLSSGMALGKSANALNIRKNARGIQKYSSSNENMFLRGAGLTYNLFPDAEATIFFSRKKIDAGVSVTDPEGKILEVSSLQNSGLHATPSQLHGKDILGETIAGGNFTYNHRLFKIGATISSLQYDAELIPAERIYNQFDFRGRSNTNYGLDYQFSLGALRLFGEGALCSSGGTAIAGGAVANLSPLISLSALYRNYSRDYHSYFSNGFGENSNTANEKGFYLGALFYPFKKFKLSAWFDFFSFPWMRYGAYFPSSGSEYFFQVDYDHSRNLHMYLSYKHKYKPENSPAGESIIRELVDLNASRLRYHVNYFISPVLEFRNRVELSHYNREYSETEKGFLLYQDILYKPVKLPLSFAFRYAVFETDSYDTRLYAYENDVLYAFSSPAYYDKGFRTYLLMQYSPGEMIDFWIRFAITKLPDMEKMGSGLTEISGNARSDLKAQIRLRF